MTENKKRNETNNEWEHLYKTTFDGIIAPYRLYRKVADMKNPTKSKTSRIKKGVIAATVALSAVAGSNLAVYAATGTGWVGRIVVSWQEKEQEVVFRKEVSQNGETYYIGTVQNEKGDSLTITTNDPSVLEGKSFAVDGMEVYVILKDGTKKKIEVHDQEEDFSAGLVLVTPLPEK